MLIADAWRDYAVLATGDGEKLERWGDVVLRRPDPQVIWPQRDAAPWRCAHAWYHRSGAGGGAWEYSQPLPESWVVGFDSLRFRVRPTGFKHTGLFPEQAVNWRWMADKIRSAGRAVRVLNLFAYTGGATLACAAAGAEVCHVDAAKGMVAWARENASLSGLGDAPVRYIVDDCRKFVQREARRGRVYDAVIMDPPSYGRGPGGEMWKLEDELFALIGECLAVLSGAPLFFLLNAYTTGLQPGVLSALLRMSVAARHGGRVRSDEIGLPVKAEDIVLPCGASGRWEA